MKLSTALLCLIISVLSVCQCNAIKSLGNSINSVSCNPVDENSNNDNNKVNRNEVGRNEVNRKDENEMNRYVPNANLEGGEENEVENLREIVEKVERNEYRNEVLEITAAMAVPTNAKIANNNPKTATIIANNNAQIAKDVTKIATNIAKIANNNAKLNNTPVVKYSLFTKMDKDNKRVLTYYGLMLAGAVARSASATAVHPLNVVKTMLQTKEGKFPELKWHILTRGAGSQFVMSVPHGALNFVVTETTKEQLEKITSGSKTCQKIPKKILNPTLDFLSSALSTFICSVVSTPQMVLTDRIMAGYYPNLVVAIASISRTEGISGFYKGWFPALVQKIPSYALTWMFFQQIKLTFMGFLGRAGTTFENTLMGSFAAAGACCIMIPIDTIKTRIVMQRGEIIYHGMWDCFQQILQHEGVGSLYRALPPRLFAVVPMIGIQFAVYELMKRSLVGLPPPKKEKALKEAQLKFPNMTPQEALDAIREAANNAANHAKNWIKENTAIEIKTTKEQQKKK